VSGRPVHRVVIARGSRGAGMERIRAEARGRGVPLHEVDPGALDAMARTRSHQGVVAIAAAVPYVPIEEILERRAGVEPPFLLLADGVQDPGNLGSLLRTGDASGVHGVVVPARRSAGLTEAAVKAAAGGAETVPVARVANLSQAVELLKRRGIWVIGADPRAGTPYHRADYTDAVALVLGGEDRGLSRLLRERCDVLVGIPMMGRLGSLNVAVAGALLMYEVRRQRGFEGFRRHS
ncbi:MAG: 23S rRNA (guanosine(2251)-2'-O)-methyltransferase RlmB, partial [Actinobacteria bacterium]|nr:23S rRNA (guanosine(2251)-2'-O)-methyltransferase RlmB [Actinomycetota bacterium]